MEIQDKHISYALAGCMLFFLFGMLFGMFYQSSQFPFERHVGNIYCAIAKPTIERNATLSRGGVIGDKATILLECADPSSLKLYAFNFSIVEKQS